MKMKTRLIVAALAGALAIGSIGGCATFESKTKTEGILGAGIGGVAMHALTGGASTAWHAVGTVAGVIGGYFVGQKVADDGNKKK